MRTTALAMMAMMLASCATGQSVGSVDEFQQISAGQIDGDFSAQNIKIRNRYALIFTSYWTAITPDGAVFACSRDLSADQCKKQGR